MNIDHKTAWVCIALTIGVTACTRVYAVDYQQYQTRTTTYTMEWPLCRNVAREKLSQCVTDGDTVRHQYRSYRIGNLDTPETRGKCDAETSKAAEAKELTRSLLANAHSYAIKVYIDPLTGDATLDKYGRILADISADGVDIATALKSKGLARDYDGGTKQSWCP